MDWKIPLFKIYSDKDDINGMARVIDSSMHWAEGSVIDDFENRIADYNGVRYCVAFNSGTSALHAILLAYGIGEGDEVIVPSFTFISTANAVLFVGAKPVFADIEDKLYGLNPKDVVKKINRRTKAVITVHYGGSACRINELKQLCRKKEIRLIEDGAESFGAKVDNKMVGTFGDSAMLSFCQNKIITTGEGGAALTNSRKVHEKLKMIRSHGRSLNGNYFSSIAASDYVVLGYNFRLPSALAGLGIAQLKKAKRLIDKRRFNAAYLTEKLNKISNRIITPHTPEGYFQVYQLYSIRLERYRDEMIQYLASKGIMTKVYFQPVHLSYFYRRRLKEKYDMPVTEKISKEILSLPMYPAMSKDELDYIVNEIKNFIRRRP